MFGSIAFIGAFLVRNRVLEVSDPVERFIRAASSQGNTHPTITSSHQCQGLCLSNW